MRMRTKSQRTKQMPIVAPKYVIMDGITVPREINLLCEQVAEFDFGSGYGYRCTTCNAVIGSTGMPKNCATLYAMQNVVDKLKGKKC